MSQQITKNWKAQWSWALYDWANSTFVTSIMVVFFPLFFRSYWGTSAEGNSSTFYLGLFNSIAGVFVAVMAPFLGALADRIDAKKPFLLGFILLGALPTMGLALLDSNYWLTAALLYAFASVGFMAGNIFYDALIVNVSSKDSFDKLSCFGYSLGYLGGGILFLLHVTIYNSPESFGFINALGTKTFIFCSVGLWWLLFSIPLFLFVKEDPKPRTTTIPSVLKTSLKQLKGTSLKLIHQKSLLYFLIGYLFYIDGVNTIAKMAIDFGLQLGFSPKSLISAILITQFIGFPSALLFGYAGSRWGPGKGIYLGLFVYILTCIGGAFMTTELHFYGLACALGVVQGGIQALSRSYFAAMVPPESSAEYFGFYNMLGKFSAILGPLLVGVVSLYFKSPRASILSILLFFLVGGAFFYYSQRRLKKDRIAP